MNVIKSETETYVIQDVPRLDPVTVYVTNYEVGKGKIVIECYGSAWSYFWGGMGERNLQEFFISCDNAYILGNLLKETRQTNFDEISKRARKLGFDIRCETDVEMAMSQNEMRECFGDHWFMDLPECNTNEYNYVSRIVDAIKSAFSR